MNYNSALLKSSPYHADEMRDLWISNTKRNWNIYQRENTLVEKWSVK